MIAKRINQPRNLDKQGQLAQGLQILPLPKAGCEAGRHKAKFGIETAVQQVHFIAFTQSLCRESAECVLCSLKIGHCRCSERLIRGPEQQKHYWKATPLTLPGWLLVGLPRLSRLPSERKDRRRAAAEEDARRGRAIASSTMISDI